VSPDRGAWLKPDPATAQDRPGQGAESLARVRRRARRIDDSVEHLKTLPDAVTTIDTSSSARISITCKR
jgi:hypothetical protein